MWPIHAFMKNEHRCRALGIHHKSNTVDRFTHKHNHLCFSFDFFFFLLSFSYFSLCAPFITMRIICCYSVSDQFYTHMKNQAVLILHGMFEL